MPCACTRPLFGAAKVSILMHRDGRNWELVSRKRDRSHYNDHKYTIPRSDRAHGCGRKGTGTTLTSQILYVWVYAIQFQELENDSGRRIYLRISEGILRPMETISRSERTGYLLSGTWYSISGTVDQRAEVHQKQVRRTYSCISSTILNSALLKD
jgi:hypothetical protein